MDKQSRYVHVPILNREGGVTIAWAIGLRNHGFKYRIAGGKNIRLQIIKFCLFLNYGNNPLVALGWAGLCIESFALWKDTLCAKGEVKGKVKKADLT